MALGASTSGFPMHVLLEGISEYVLDKHGANITGLSCDSRRTNEGDLFLAYQGAQANGVDYIHDALAAGAIAVAVDAGFEYDAESYAVPLIPVANLRYQVGAIANRFFGYPSEHLNIVGVTGTNGKTSVCYFLAQALAGYEGNEAGLIGTLGYGQLPRLHAGMNTTPDPITLQRLLADMCDEGINTVAMEVSSHGIEQCRVKGVKFNIAVFTNLTAEHLDYHGDMQTYAEVKRRLFLTKELECAVINCDDEYGRKLCAELSDKLRLVKYGIVDEFTEHVEDSETVTAIIRYSRIESLCLEIDSPWGRGQLEARLIGRFNAYNLLACLSTLCLLNVPFHEALERLSGVSSVPGRMEPFAVQGHACVIVDYAHTADAMEKSLSSLRQQCKGRLICVFGCGGDRDTHKRPEMGRIVEQYADQVIVTSDNPRNEQPESIIQDILAGMRHAERVIVTPDRAEAITCAIDSAVAEDIVLIAGKGHETYQEISGKRYPFSDRQLVRNILGSGA